MWLAYSVWGIIILGVITLLINSARRDKAQNRICAPGIMHHSNGYRDDKYTISNWKLVKALKEGAKRS